MKLKAFTLPEIVVVLAIASLVMIMGYLAYQLMQVQMNIYRDNSRQFVKVHEFVSCFDREVYTSNSISRHGNSVYIISQDTITYCFYDNLIKKEFNNTIDSIFIKVTGITSSLESQQVINGNIDHLLFNIHFAEKIYPVCFSKEYSGSDYFMHNTTKLLPDL